MQGVPSTQHSRPNTSQGHYSLFMYEYTHIYIFLCIYFLIYRTILNLVLDLAVLSLHSRRELTADSGKFVIRTVGQKQMCSR